MRTETNFNPLAGREIELYVNGEYKRLGYIREMNSVVEFEEFNTIMGHTERLPRETRTIMIIELYSGDTLSMFTEMVQQLRINNIIMFAIIKSWDLNVDVYENILKLEIVVTDTINTSKIPTSEVKKLAREDYSFKEELL